MSCQNIELICHSSYEPDLTPIDFFIPPYQTQITWSTIFDNKKKRLVQSKFLVWSYYKRYNKIASKIDSKAGESVLIYMGNILKNNKINFSHLIIKV